MSRAGGSLVIAGIGELITNASGRPGDLGIVRDVAVAIVDGTVAWVGTDVELPAAHRGLPTVHCEGRAALPGFVDAHTHVVFAGDRADEFAQRLRGETYADVLASGGGIRSTVAATRAASEHDLVDSARQRLRRMLGHGTTTAEVKSGYGLDVDTERRTLAAIATLDATQPVSLVPTYLGAHVVPAEYADDRDRYLDLIADEALPACAPMARYVDVFCDEGGFTVEESRRVLLAGRDHGLRARVHADELAHSGGARLAAELGAVSADHLVHVDDDDIGALREAGTVAVVLPATSFSLRAAYAPARRMWDAGVTLALGTDCNPGTSYTESMPFAIALACLEMGLTPEEAVWSATCGGAAALELEDRGRIVPGARGDIVVLDAPSYTHLPYRPGGMLTWQVVGGGRIEWP